MRCEFCKRCLPGGFPLIERGSRELGVLNTEASGFGRKLRAQPPHCELDARQKRKCLPFPQLQPPKKIEGFYIRSLSLSLHTRRLLFFLAKYWPVGILMS